MQRGASRQIRQFCPPRPCFRKDPLFFSNAAARQSARRRPAFLEQIKIQMDMISGSYSAFHLRKTCRNPHGTCPVWQYLFRCEKALGFSQEPCRKGSQDPTIAVSISCIVNLALAASPIIPETAQKIWQMLGFKTDLAKQNW